MTTVADVVAALRDGRLDDFVREAVALVARELMKGEISAEIGAELGEVAPESRLTHRNGYRPGAWETRVGEIELAIPRKRFGRVPVLETDGEVLFESTAICLHLADRHPEAELIGLLGSHALHGRLPVGAGRDDRARAGGARVRAALPERSRERHVWCRSVPGGRSRDRANVGGA
jgi:hypothetical protein